MKDIVTRESCPEWSGYNTQLARQTGMAIEPKAKVVCLPLIDKAPASPSTILTAIEKGLTLLNDAGTGQDNLVFTVDQQLYKVTVHILFHTPSYFMNIIPVLGGMHSHGFHSCHLHHPLSCIESHSFCDIRKCGQDDEREEVPSKLQGFKNANRRDAPQPLA